MAHFYCLVRFRARITTKKKGRDHYIKLYWKQHVPAYSFRKCKEYWYKLMKWTVSFLTLAWQSITWDIKRAKSPGELLHHVSTILVAGYDGHTPIVCGSHRVEDLLRTYLKRWVSALMKVSVLAKKMLCWVNLLAYLYQSLLFCHQKDMSVSFMFVSCLLND